MLLLDPYFLSSSLFAVWRYPFLDKAMENDAKPVEKNAKIAFQNVGN